jgi:hypothetical protein
MATRYRVDIGALRSDQFYYAVERQRKILRKIMNQFRERLDPDGLHTYWCVSDWFYWTGNVSDKYCFGLLIKRMDGGTPPKPTGDEWLWAICWPRRNAPYQYDDAYLHFGSNTTEANKYFWYGWDNTVNSAIDANGLILFRYSFCNFREVELTGTFFSAGTTFNVGDLVHEDSGVEKAGEVVWVDGGDPLHIRVRMKVGFDFVGGEALSNPDSTTVLQGIAIDDTYQWNVELTGGTWGVGGPFIVGDEIYNTAYPERKAIVKWVDPLDDRHMRVLMTEGARFRTGDDIEKDVSNTLGNITINDANMHDVGFNDNVHGIFNASTYVAIRNIELNGGADFTPGEKIVNLTRSGHAIFYDWSNDFGNWPIQRILMNYAIGDFRPGDVISTDRGGPPDATAIVMPTCWVQTNTSTGTYLTGEEIYTSSGRAFAVKPYPTGSSWLQFLWGGRMELTSTDFNGVPVEGAYIQDAAGSKYGYVASVNIAIPGEIRWTIIYEHDAFSVGEDLHVVGDPLNFYINNIKIQNHETGGGMFSNNQTLYGRDSGVSRTIRGEDYNLYENAGHTAAKSIYNQINDFFPRQRNASYNNAQRGVFLPSIRWGWQSGYHAAQAIIFGWDQPFMAVYSNENYAATVGVYHIFGQIISPLNGIGADPHVYGTFGSNLYANEVNPGRIENYRIEALTGFNSGGGVLSTWGLYYNTNFYSLTLGLRSDGDWDWNRITVAGGGEFKGFLDERLFRTIGYSGTYEYMKFYEDQNDPEIVFTHIPYYYCVPWKANEQTFPPINWELLDMDILGRERY